MEERFALTLEEAAAAMGVSLPTMRDIARRQDFPAIRKGRRWIIPRRAFADWLDQQAHSRTVMAGREASW